MQYKGQLSLLMEKAGVDDEVKHSRHPGGSNQESSLTSFNFTLYRPDYCVAKCYFL